MLLAYKDELMEGYLRRILYAIDDATQSLIFWRGQVKIGPIWFPLHSLIIFCMAILLVERPYMLPAVIPLSFAWFMFSSMYWRLQEPSPWRQCFSFGHYLRILLLGHSALELETIKPGQGYEESQAKKEALQRRVDDDRAFMKQKDALEDEIRTIEKKDSMETQVQQILDIELLNVLGNIQGIVGGEIRLVIS